MLVHLPNNLILNEAADNLMAVLFDDHDVKVSRKKSRDVVARMLGFEGHEDFIERNLPVSRSYWDEDQSIDVADARMRQYARALEDEKFKGVNFEKANLIASQISVTGKNARGTLNRVLLQPFHTERWDRISPTTGKYLCTVNKRPFNSCEFAARLLAHASELDDDDYAGIALIAAERRGYGTVVVGVRHKDHIITVGHITYKTEIDVSQLYHHVDIAEIFVDQNRVGALASRREHSIVDVEGALMNIILADIGEKHDDTWQAYLSDYGTFKIGIAFSGDLPAEATWPILLMERLHNVVGDSGWHQEKIDAEEDVKFFPRYSIELENGLHEVLHLPPIGRRFVEEKSPVGSFVKKFIRAANKRTESSHSFGRRHDLALRIDPCKQNCSVVKIAETFVDLEIRPIEMGDEKGSRVSLVDGDLKERNELVEFVASADATTLFDLCDGKIRYVFLAGDRSEHQKLVLVDAEIWDSGKWKDGHSVDWLETDPISRPPRHRLYLQALSELLRDPFKDYMRQGQVAT